MSRHITKSSLKDEKNFDHFQQVMIGQSQPNRSLKTALAISIWLTLGAIWLPGMGFLGPVVTIPASQEKKPPKRVRLKIAPDDVVQVKPRRQSQAERVPIPEHLIEDPQPHLEMVDLEVPELVEDAFTEPVPDLPDGPPMPMETVYTKDMSGVEPPLITKKVPPEFPKRAIKLRMQGYVILKAILGKNGKIRDIQVVQGLGKGKFGFEKAAIEALKKWKFEPGRLHDKPVDILMNLKLTFALQ